MSLPLNVYDVHLNNVQLVVVARDLHGIHKALKEAGYVTHVTFVNLRAKINAIQKER